MRAARRSPARTSALAAPPGAPNAMLIAGLGTELPAYVFPSAVVAMRWYRLRCLFVAARAR